MRTRARACTHTLHTHTHTHTVMTEEDAEELFRKIDDNNNGFLDLAEFCRAVNSTHPPQTNDQLENIMGDVAIEERTNVEDGGKGRLQPGLWAQKQGASSAVGSLERETKRDRQRETHSVECQTVGEQLGPGMPMLKGGVEGKATGTRDGGREDGFSAGEANILQVYLYSKRTCALDQPRSASGALAGSGVSPAAGGEIF